MSSLDLSQNNEFDTDHLKLEIFYPQLIRLPIPENRQEEIVPTKLMLLVSTKSRNSVKFDLVKLIPELLDANNYLIQKQSRIKRDSQFIIVKPDLDIFISVILALFWQDGKLLLTAKLLHDSFEDCQTTESEWIFEGLKPKNYKFKFVYSPNDRDRYPITSWIDMKLIPTIQTQENAVEIDGLVFETVVPNPEFNLPSKSLYQKILYALKSMNPARPIKPEPNISIQIGLKLTNQTSTPVRFNFEHLYVPDILRDGKLINWDSYCIRPETVPKCCFPLVQPGEQIIFYPEMILFWSGGNKFRIQAIAKDGFCFTSDALNPGNYSVRFTYNNTKSTVKFSDLLTGNHELLEEFWIGNITTPFLKICLVESK